MRNKLKGKEVLNKIKLFSVAMLVFGLISVKGYSQNYPNQPTPGNQPPVTPNPTNTVPGTMPSTNPPQPDLNTPTIPMPQPPSLNLPNSNQPTIDTSQHLYNPIKPDTGRMKSQLEGTTLFYNYDQSLTGVVTENNGSFEAMTVGELEEKS